MQNYLISIVSSGDDRCGLYKIRAKSNLEAMKKSLLILNYYDEDYGFEEGWEAFVDDNNVTSNITIPECVDLIESHGDEILTFIYNCSQNYLVYRNENAVLYDDDYLY